MKLGKHKQCSSIAVNMITSVLNRNNTPQSDMRLLQSVFLGNWLTDTAQVYDPAFFNRIHKIARKLGEFLDEYSKVIKSKWPNFLVEFTVEHTMGSLRKRCKSAQTLFDPDNKQRLCDFLGNLVYIYGYFTFVRPDNKTLLIDDDKYKFIFKKLFSQYSPHKHFDRWPVGEAVDNRRRYVPITDTVKYLAEIYTKVDLHWSRSTCIKGIPQGDEERRTLWCYNLALLGHALHTTEDFFAHTNFVEHLLEMLAFDNQWTRPTDKNKLYIHDRRLRKLGTNPDAETEPSVTGVVGWDPNLAGGTFDFVDTFFSLRSMITPPKTKEEKEESFEPGEAYYKVLDIINRDTKPTAQQIKSELGFDDLAADVVNTIFTLRELNQAFKAINLSNAPILRSLKEVIDFIEKFTSFVPDFVKDINEKLTDKVDGLIGKNRIGCHSLMAKDGPNSLHFEIAFQLGKSVDSYILNVLLRNESPAQLSGTRQASGSSDKSQTKVDSNIWIDWQHLLDFFLSHPEKMSNDPNCAECIHPRLGNLEPSIMKIGAVHGHVLKYVSKDIIDDRAKLLKAGEIIDAYNKEAKKLAINILPLSSEEVGTAFA